MMVAINLIRELPAVGESMRASEGEEADEYMCWKWSSNSWSNKREIRCCRTGRSVKANKISKPKCGTVGSARI